MLDESTVEKLQKNNNYIQQLIQIQKKAFQSVSKVFEIKTDNNKDFNLFGKSLNIKLKLKIQIFTTKT